MHLRLGKKVRILNQLRESDLPVGDANRTLCSRVAYLSCCQYTDHQLIILGVKELVNTLSQWRMLTLAIRRKLYGCRFYSER